MAKKSSGMVSMANQEGDIVATKTTTTIASDGLESLLNPPTNGFIKSIKDSIAESCEKHKKEVKEIVYGAMAELNKLGDQAQEELERHDRLVLQLNGELAQAYDQSMQECKRFYAEKTAKKPTDCVNHDLVIYKAFLKNLKGFRVSFEDLYYLRRGLRS